MSFSPSPPPPLPSPLLVLTPLPSPPPFTNRRRLLNHAFHRSSSTPRFAHDAPKAENRRRPALPPFSSPRTIERTNPSRCRSPPPAPTDRSPPPPVPPIPAFVLTQNHSFIRPPRRPSTPSRASAFDLYLDHQREDMCCEAHIGSALTRVQFVAVHNPTGQCHS